MLGVLRRLICEKHSAHLLKMYIDHDMRIGKWPSLGVACEGAMISTKFSFLLCPHDFDWWNSWLTCHFWGRRGTSLQLPNYRWSSILQDIYFFFHIQRWLSTRVEIHKNQGPQFKQNYIICQRQKHDEHGASFQSSPKINPMLITRFICIQWKFFITRPVYSLTMEVSTEALTCNKVINAFKQYNSWTNCSGNRSIFRVLQLSRLTRAYQFVCEGGELLILKAVMCCIQVVLYQLKGHSQKRDCTDLDTTFASLKSVYLNLKSHVRVVYVVVYFYPWFNFYFPLF